MRITSYRSPSVAALRRAGAGHSAGLAGPGTEQTRACRRPVAATQPALPPGTNADTGWPRTVTLAHGTAVWYQPQIESWTNQKHIVAWSAVAYTPTGAKEPALGTIKIEGPTKVSVDDRVVSFDMRDHRVQLQVAVARPGEDAGRRRAARCRRDERVLDLDRVLAYVADSPLAVKNVEGIKADPPKVFSAPAPAILINLDGEPIWSPIKDVDLQVRGQHQLGSVRARADQDASTCATTTSWLEATAVTGPWKAVGQAARQLLEAAGRRQLEGREGGAARQEALVEDDAEGVRRAPTPAELIVIDGRAQLPGGRGRAQPAVGEQHRERPVPHGPDRRLLLPGGRPLVQVGQPRRPVDVRDADAARGLQEDPDRASAVARAGVGAGHATGHRGGAAGDDSADRARQQEGTEGAGRRLRRRQARAEADRRQPRASSRSSTPTRTSSSSATSTTCASRACGSCRSAADGPWEVAVEHPAGDLHDPGELAGQPRHLRDRGRR